MTKRDFGKHVIVSALLAVIAIAAILLLCVSMFAKYSGLTEEDTSMASGTVSDVYRKSGKRTGVVVEMMDGEQLYLMYPHFSKELYDTIGYDLEGLSDLLEGKRVEYLRTNELPWMIEIYVDDTVIDNRALSAEQMTATRIGIVILGIIMLAFPICGEAAYIKAKYNRYRKAEKKRIRSAKRSKDKKEQGCPSRK